MMVDQNSSPTPSLIMQAITPGGPYALAPDGMRTVDMQNEYREMIQSPKEAGQSHTVMSQIGPKPELEKKRASPGGGQIVEMRLEGGHLVIGVELQDEGQRG